MAKIGDIWAKLTLKKDEFSKGLEKAKTETKSFGTGMKNVVSLAKAGWAAVGVAAVAAAKAFINSSQTFGDAWNRTVSSMTSRWQNFMSNINRSFADKKGLWKLNFGIFGLMGMGFDREESKASAAAGKAKADALDALFEVENSFKIATTQMAPRLNKLYLDMMNTALSDKDRNKAAKEYRDVLEPIYARRAEAYRNVMDKTIENWAAVTGLAGKYSNEKIVELVKLMGQNEEVVKAGWSDFYKAYQSTNDESASEMVDAIVNYNNVANELNDTLKRIDLVALRTAGSGSSAVGSGGDTKEIAPEIDPMEIANRQIDKYVDAIYEGQSRVETAWDDILDMADDVKWEMPELDISAAEASLDRLVEDWQTKQQEIQSLNEAMNQMLKDAIAESLTNGTQAVTDSLFGLNDNNTAAILNGFLMPFADMAKKLGKLLVTTGLGIMAFKDSLQSLNPWVAIAAGVALIALGAAMSSAIRSIGSGSTSASGGGYSGGGGTSSASTKPEDLETEMTIYVKGKLDGRDILLAGARAADYYGR